MRDEKNPIISKQALEEIKRTVSEGKQVFVFVHRKGYSNYVVATHVERLSPVLTARYP
jgi:primosomal protein N' (replication factor Y)